MKSLRSVASDLIRGPEIPTAFLRDLPKVDLHVHLDGSLRFDSFVELSEAVGRPLPGGSREAARAALSHGHEPNLDAYLALFDHTIGVLQTKEALRRCAREIVEDCAGEEIWHAEIRFSPALHQQEGLSAVEAVEAVLAGMHEGTGATGISAGLLLAGLRHRPMEESIALAEIAVRFKGRGVSGYDLAGVEAQHPAKRFTPVFQHLLSHNINCTVHAGEDWGPDSIHQALHYLNAHRVSHATRLLEDPELARFVADHRIPIEVGLSSNLRTHAMPPNTVHPLRRFLQHGLRVALTTNNRLFLDTTLTDELRLAADEFDLTLLEIENLCLSAFKSSFLPQAERVVLVRRAVAGFSEVRLRHGLGVAE
jgi:adenosine deaminase